jgi:insertion element IS1 protein InsB
MIEQSSSQMKPMNCPKCGSSNSSKNGKTYYGKQRYICKDCGRQYIEGSEYKHISKDTYDLIEKLLLERLSLAGISRAAGISAKRLQDFVNQLFSRVVLQVLVTPKRQGSLTIELDELWSFVAVKTCKQWVWLALDTETREIVGVYIGNRSAESAQKLWDSVPSVYRQCATCYTDFWEAYQLVLPSKRHKAVGKDSGKTNHVERFNNTLRQRVSRLVRKTLSFSKKLENHIGAIWYFIHYYNSVIREQLHYCI